MTHVLQRKASEGSKEPRALLFSQGRDENTVRLTISIGTFEAFLTQDMGRDVRRREVEWTWQRGESADCACELAVAP